VAEHIAQGSTVQAVPAVYSRQCTTGVAVSAAGLGADFGICSGLLVMLQKFLTAFYFSFPCFVVLLELCGRHRGGAVLAA